MLFFAAAAFFFPELFLFAGELFALFEFLADAFFAGGLFFVAFGFVAFFAEVCLFGVLLLFAVLTAGEDTLEVVAGEETLGTGADAGTDTGAGVVDVVVDVPDAGTVLGAGTELVEETLGFRSSAFIEFVGLVDTRPEASIESLLCTFGWVGTIESLDEEEIADSPLGS